MLRELFDYSAINGKVHAMLGNRLRQSEFDRLMQAPTVPQLASILAGTDAWGHCLQGADFEEIHRAELEQRLRLGLQREYDKLATFAARGLGQLLRALASRAQAGELLRFLRFLAAGHPADFTPNLPADVLEHCPVRFSLLQESPDRQGLMQAVAATVYGVPLAKAWPEGEELDYARVETAVQGAYFKGVLEAVARGFTGADRRELEEYFLCQCDFDNICRIVRLKKHFQVPQEDVVRYLLPYSSKLKGATLQSLVAAPNGAGVLELLRSGPYRKVFSQGEHQDIESYAFAFYRSGRVRMRQGKPSAFTALVYLDLKERELKNIINIIECVRYQLPPSRMPTYLTPIY